MSRLIATPSSLSFVLPTQPAPAPALLLGGQVADTEQDGDCYAYQQITCPAAATLTFSYYPYTEDSISYDWQECQIQDSTGAMLAQVFKVCSNDQAWTPVTYDLSAYAGQTIRIWFNAHGDGASDLTWMYVRNVVCGTAITNGNFSNGLTGWTVDAPEGFTPTVANSNGIVMPAPQDVSLSWSGGDTPAIWYDAESSDPWLTFDPGTPAETTSVQTVTAATGSATSGSLTFSVSSWVITNWGIVSMPVPIPEGGWQTVWNLNRANIAISPIDSYAYHAFCFGTSEDTPIHTYLVKLDRATNTSVWYADIHAPTDVNEFYQPWQVIVSPDGVHLYIGYFHQSSPGVYWLYVDKRLASDGSYVGGVDTISMRGACTDIDVTSIGGVDYIAAAGLDVNDPSDDHHPMAIIRGSDMTVIYSASYDPHESQAESGSSVTFDSDGNLWWTHTLVGGADTCIERITVPGLVVSDYLTSTMLGYVPYDSGTDYSTDDKVTFFDVSPGYWTCTQPTAAGIPPGSSTILGSVTSGTFLVGETMLQASTGANAPFIQTVTGGVMVGTMMGHPDNSGTFVGQTNGAIFAPTGYPAVVTNWESNEGMWPTCDSLTYDPVDNTMVGVFGVIIRKFTIGDPPVFTLTGTAYPPGNLNSGSGWGEKSPKVSAIGTNWMYAHGTIYDPSLSATYSGNFPNQNVLVTADAQPAFAYPPATYGNYQTVTLNWPATLDGDANNPHLSPQVDATMWCGSADTTGSNPYPNGYFWIDIAIVDPLTVPVTVTGASTYLAKGLTFSATEKKDDGSPDTCTVTGFLDDLGINEHDVRARLYDNATFELRVVNWDDPSMGCVKLLKGTVGDIKTENGLWTVELRGLAQKLTTQVGSLYGPTCRAQLFDGDPSNRWKCGLDRTQWQQIGIVGSCPDSTTLYLLSHMEPLSGGGFYPISLYQIGTKGDGTSYLGTANAPDGWFDDGVITFTSGVLNGYSFEIQTYVNPPYYSAAHVGGLATLFAGAPMPAQPSTYDTFVIEPGCSKDKGTCHAKFGNLVNITSGGFSGEAEIPGIGVLSAISRTQVPTK